MLGFPNAFLGLIAEPVVITVATTLVYFEMTHVNIRDNNLYLPGRLHETLAWAVRARLDVLLVIAWLLVLALLVVLRSGEALFA